MNGSSPVKIHDFYVKLVTHVPGGGTRYFSVRGRATEQGIIFRIPSSGQGIIFVKISSMTGSIFVIFDSKRLFSAICILRM